MLHIGKTATGTSYFAQKDGEPTIYTVQKAPAEWVLAEPSKFQKAADAGAATASAKAPRMPPGHPMVPPH